MRPGLVACVLGCHRARNIYAVLAGRVERADHDVGELLLDAGELRELKGRHFSALSQDLRSVPSLKLSHISETSE